MATDHAQSESRSPCPHCGSQEVATVRQPRHGRWARRFGLFLEIGAVILLALATLDFGPTMLRPPYQLEPQAERHARLAAKALNTLPESTLASVLAEIRQTDTLSPTTLDKFTPDQRRAWKRVQAYGGGEGVWSRQEQMEAFLDPISRRWFKRSWLILPPLIALGWVLARSRRLVKCGTCGRQP